MFIESVSLPAGIPDRWPFTIIELGRHGLRRTPWEELEIVDHWRRYLRDPRSYLRHFITAPDRLT